MISKMDLESKHGKTVQNLKEIFKMGLKRDLVNLNGKTDLHIKENLIIIY